MRRSLALLLLIGCAPSTVTHVGAPDVTLTPSPVVFENGWVGFTQSATVTVGNRSPVRADLEVTVTGPFAAEVPTLSLGGAGAGTLVVTYRPQVPGHHVGSLQVGNARIALLGDARQPPDCQSSACVESTFDMLSRSCTTRWKTDGIACQTACATGTCQQGACTGAFATCDDFDACTIDTCNEAVGCGHVAKECPRPSKVCRVAACDPSTGCGEADAPDGTACGANLCTDIDEQVCISGVCVTRPRPGGTRCGDTWVPAYYDPRFFSAAAYDDALGQLLFQGGFTTTYAWYGNELDDTWAWDGGSWLQVLPLSAPRPSGPGRMAYDRARGVAVFVGGNNGTGTWEYDGVQWQARSSAHLPPPRSDYQLYYDAANQTVRLYGGLETGFDGGYYQTWLGDLWEWDGGDWTDRTPASSPPERWYPTIAYDEARSRLVLFGGRVGNSYQFVADTWELDGSQWTQLNPAHQPPGGAGWLTTSYDARRGRVVLVDQGYSSNGVVWEWDGADWTAHLYYDGPGWSSTPGVQLFDPLVGQVAMFAFDDLTRSYSANWHWDGDAWWASDVLPLERRDVALAYDSTAQRTVMFGGDEDRNPLDDTWVFDGARWTQLPVSGPSARSRSAMVYDAARKQMVLFGGSTGGYYPSPVADTWVFDGSAWTPLQPLHSPPARFGHAMAYDSALRRIVLFGGSDGTQTGFDDTWVWDGSDWTQLSPMTSPSPRADARMAYDAKRAQLVLYGGADPYYGLPPDQGWSFGDTWTFDGAEWAQQSSPSMLHDRTLQGMAYDPVRQVVMMFGGWGFPDLDLNDTWEWDGAQWTQRAPAFTGPHLSGIQMVYDEARADFVVFGGQGVGANWGNNQTWLYIPP